MKLIEGFLKQHHQDALAYFEILNESAAKAKGERPIVFIGDSLTEECRFTEYFPGRWILNRGISGDTSAGVRERIEVNVCNANPRKVFILVGTNDLDRGVPIGEILGNLEKSIGKIREKSPNTAIYLQSLYPVSKKGLRKGGKRMVGKRTNPVLDELNGRLKKLAETKGILYIDINSALKDQDGELNSEYSLEGLHLNGKGYAIVMEQLRKYIEDMI